MEDKKSFVVYTNWKQYIDELTDEEVGMWTRWMFDYCNDKWLDKEIEYPNNTAVKVLCKLTKDILKKDLAKYKDKRKRIDDINERKRIEREAKSKQSSNEIEHEIVNEIDNNIEQCNMLNVKCNMLNDNSKELNNNDLSISKDISKSSGEVSREKPTPLIILPCIGNYQHPIFKDDIDHYKELYPAVDILQQFKNMVGWLESNPQNRKTKNGVKSFITRWLSKCQDKAPKVESSSCNQNFTTLGDDYLNEDFKQRPNETYEEYRERIIKDFRKENDPTASFGGVEKI